MDHYPKNGEMEDLTHFVKYSNEYFITMIHGCIGTKSKHHIK